MINRREVLAAALVAPLGLATAAVATPTVEAVRQEELEAIMKGYDALKVRCLGVKLRLNASAQVEPGRWAVKADAPDQDDVFVETCGLTMCGIDVAR